MQRLQFSISWLQTTEVSFTSVLETEVKLTSVLAFCSSFIILVPKKFLRHFLPPPPPLFQTPLLLIFGKVSNPLIIRYSRVRIKKSKSRAESKKSKSRALALCSITSSKLLFLVNLKMIWTFSIL